MNHAYVLKYFLSHNKESYKKLSINCQDVLLNEKVFIDNITSSNYRVK